MTGHPRMQGKVCLVTGAAQGIGRCITEAFLAEGAMVIATDRNLAPLRDLAADPSVRLRELDVTQPEAIAAAAAEHGDVEVLVNCAGYVPAGTLLQCDDADFERTLALNVTAMFRMMKAFVPAMAARRCGSIINIASVVSSVMAAPDRFAYAASKAAVIGMSMSVARDFAGSGVRCNAISPGTVETPSLHQRMAATGDAEKARTMFVGRQLLGRLGMPEEVAAVAVLLGSDEATFITGSNLVIDGGMSL